MNRQGRKPNRNALNLTPRQQEVFDMLVRGLSAFSVAGLLHIDEKTVETHRYQIYRKLRINSHPELILFAVRKRLLTAEMLESP